MRGGDDVEDVLEQGGCVGGMMVGMFCARGDVGEDDGGDVLDRG